MSIDNYEESFAKVIADPRYQRGIEYGQPRSGHPEGSVKAHILELENNLERLKPRLESVEDYWQLKFLIHTHDTFKHEARLGAAITDPDSHASLARAFAAEFITAADLLNMIQYHDEGFALWKQFRARGEYSRERFEQLLKTIEDWDLFLIFNIVDGCTAGKDQKNVKWFINAVRKFQILKVAKTWVLA